MSYSPIAHLLISFHSLWGVNQLRLKVGAAFASEAENYFHHNLKLLMTTAERVATAAYFFFVAVVYILFCLRHTGHTN